jgi:hypothetical protein
MQYMNVPVPPELKRALDRLARDEHRSSASQLVKLVEDGVVAAGYFERKRPEAVAA